MVDAVDTMGDDWLAEAGDHVDEVPEVVEAVVQPEAVEREPEAPEVTDTAEPSTEAPHMVPYATMKKEREARQELERRLAALEANKPVQAAPVVQQRQEVAPDPYEDPVGYNAYVESKIEQSAFNIRLQNSQRFSEEKYGREISEAAVAWAMEQERVDPSIATKVRNHPSPVEYVVQEYQRSLTHQTLNGKSPEEFAKDYAVSQGWIVSQPQTEAPAPQKPSLPKAPRSLANVPGSGSKVPANADWGEVKFALDN